MSSPTGKNHVGRRAIAPATAAFQHLHDAADNAAVVHPLDPADIRWQERLDPLSIVRRSAKTNSCSQFQILPVKESLSYCKRRKINEF
jgi:hypothetical protein